MKFKENWLNDLVDWNKYWILLATMLFSVCLFFVSKALFLMSLFLALDFGKNLIEISFPYLPLKPIDCGAICISYFYSPLLGIMLVMVYLANKLLFVRIDEDAVVSVISLVAVCFIASLFHANFILTAMILLCFKYIADLTMLFFLFDNMDFRKLAAKAVNASAGFLVFKLLILII